jgi:hypothetical protein
VEVSSIIREEPFFFGFHGEIEEIEPHTNTRTSIQRFARSRSGPIGIHLLLSEEAKQLLRVA